MKTSKKMRHILRVTQKFVAKHKIIFVTVLAVGLVISTGLCFASCSGGPNIEISTSPSGEPGSSQEEESKGGLFGIFSKKADEGTDGTDSGMSEEEDPVILAYKEDAKEGYMNNCVFLGDSRTVAAVNYRFISDESAFAQVGISHTSVSKATIANNAGREYTLQTFLASHQAPVVYVCYGVNGMAGISEEAYEKAYNSLVDEIISLAPSSKIVLMSIWPVDDNGTYKKSCQNAWIEKYNKFLLDMATQKGLHYLNVNEVLTDSNGQMKAEFNAGDGLHYAPVAYNDIIDYIIHHPVPGVSDEGHYEVKYVKPNATYTNIVKKGVDSPTDIDLNMLAPVLTQTPTPTPDYEAIRRAEEEKERKAREAEEEEMRRREEEAKKNPTATPTPTPTQTPTTLPTQNPSPAPTESPAVDPTPTVEVTPEPTPTPTPETTPEPAPTEEISEESDSESAGE